MSFVVLVGLASCKSHHKAVVRPSANQEYRMDKQSGRSDRQKDKKTLGASKSNDVDPRIGKRLVDEARTWMGTRYRYGGKTKSGTDCSGMLMTIFYDVVGLKLPRNSAAQREYCVEVPKKRLQRGDLVFFSSSKGGSKVSHVGMYVGDGKIIHASVSRGVIISRLDEKYYVTHYHSSGRVYGITYAGLGSKPPASVPDVQPADKVVAQPETVTEMTLDEFVNSHLGRDDVGHAGANAHDDSTRVSNDSIRRSDEIRENVTRAMKFGK